MHPHPRERWDAREPKGAAVASGRRGSSGRAVKRQEQGREQQNYERYQIARDSWLYIASHHGDRNKRAITLVVVEKRVSLDAP